MTGYKIKVKAIDNGNRCMLPGGWGIAGESPTGDRLMIAGRSGLYRKSTGGFALACSRFIYDIRYTLS
jgi:UDP-3-O-[3-hydroxymyristoyl] glucosamine N-acyltransferase